MTSERKPEAETGFKHTKKEEKEAGAQAYRERTPGIIRFYWTSNVARGTLRVLVLLILVVYHAKYLWKLPHFPADGHQARKGRSYDVSRCIEATSRRQFVDNI